MTPEQLPPLPAATLEDHEYELWGQNVRSDFFTADQMHAYATAATAALRAELDALRAAYRKMRNSAAGYSNYCDDTANTRRCEREYEEAEAMFRAIDAAMKEQ
jgi:hypothetical protein